MPIFDSPTPPPPDSADGGPCPDPDAQRSPHAAQAVLAGLIGDAVSHQRTVGQHDAERLTQVFRVLEFAASNAHDFVAARFGGAPARDLARRAAIAELAVALRMTERRVDRLASDAAALCRRLPAVLRGMRNGELDYEQAKVVIDAVDPIDDRLEVVAILDEQLAELARTVNPTKLRRAARRLVERVQADTMAKRHERARAERRVEVQPARDGMAWLHLLLPAADALLIKNRLCQAADRAKESEGTKSTKGTKGTNGVQGTQSTRSSNGNTDPERGYATQEGLLRRELDAEKALDQVRADLARDLLLHGVPPDSPTERSAPAEAVTAGIRPTVHVTVPVMTLLGRAEDPGVLDGYGPIDPDTARTLAAQAPSFARLLTHPVTGTVLDIDRTSYRVPADLRKWLQVRDQTCRFPGCSRPAVGCDLDHSDDWKGAGGATAHHNLAHLCAAHHHLKHDTAWSVRHLEAGVLEWTSLTGARYRTTPEGQMAIPSPGPPSDEAMWEPPPF